jgi:hypothetical protein
MSTGPSPYEQKALATIHSWKNPQAGWLGWMKDAVSWPWRTATELAGKIPGVDWVIEKAFQGVLASLNDWAQLTVRQHAIFEDFRKYGHLVHKHGDVFQLDLESVDHVIGLLDMKYKSAALGEGAVTGAAGMPGIPADVVLLLGMALRAIGEYATHYGFDVTSQQERLFALNILGFASSLTDAAKTVAMAQLVRIATGVAKKQAWKELEEHAFVVIIQKLAKQLGVRLTKAKLAQFVPVFGAAVGASYNAYYMAKVCNAAYFLYRERFLAEKYGPEIIAPTVKPAESLEVPDEPA